MTIPRAALAAIAADIPVLLWGPPGTGKSAALAALAKSQGAHLEVLIGAQLLPEDLGGIPHLIQDRVTLAPPAWSTRLKDALHAKRPAWLFFDEFSATPPQTAAAILRCVQDRVVADIDLTGCRVIAAANKSDYAVSGGHIAAPTANRFAHFSVPPPDAGAYADALLGGAWPVPEKLAKPRAEDRGQAAASIAAYVRRHTSALLAPPDSADADACSGPWPSPRSWSAAAACVGALDGGPSHPDAESAIASCVGSGAAAAWAAWRAALDLPDPEEWLAADFAVAKKMMPTRGDSQAAALSSLVASALLPRPDQLQRATAAWAIIGSARIDATIPAAKVLLAGVPAAENHPAAIEIGRRLIAVR